MAHECNLGWSGEGVNPNGRCCCNCKYQLKLLAHPWNKDFGKGPITQSIGYVCAAPDFLPNAIFFDRQHSMCEMHEFKETNDTTS
jgi:hypothetical protein